MGKIDEILEFWFQGMKDSESFSDRQSTMKRWFMKDDAFDKGIKDEFEEDIIRAKEGTYKDWEKEARGRLALFILFDQFTRNVYRNDAKMYETDPLAIDLSVRTIKEGMDQDLQFIERVFVYMPLMHSEELARQEQCVEVLTKLVEDSKKACPQNTETYSYNLEYAIKHLEVIRQFNRFPHRNKILGRESTAEEIEFLQKPGSSF